MKEDIMIESMEINQGEINMSLSGDHVKLFYAMLIQLFVDSGAENFFTLSIEDHNVAPMPSKYAITIQKCSGSDTPAEKINRLEAEIERLRAIINEVQA